MYLRVHVNDWQYNSLPPIEKFALHVTKDIQYSKIIEILHFDGHDDYEILMRFFIRACQTSLSTPIYFTSLLIIEIKLIYKIDNTINILNACK